MKLFNQPKWLKPAELQTFKYWIHLAIIAVIVLAILQWWTGVSMLSWKNVLVSTGLIGLADIIAHSILQIN